MKKFKVTSFLNERPWSGRPELDEETVAHVGKAFTQSHWKSLKPASLGQDFPKTMVHKILWMKLHQKPHKIQVPQMLQEEDYHVLLTVICSLQTLEKIPSILTV
jgi:hypothetical protein